MSELEPKEGLLEAIKRSAYGATDFELDAQIASTLAKRDVAVAWRQHEIAEAMNELLIMLADVRQHRGEIASAVEDFTSPLPPAKFRLLTRDEEA